MSRSRVELAQAVLDTWDDHSYYRVDCRHCKVYVDRDFGQVLQALRGFEHEEGCIVPIAERIVEEAKQHGW